MDELKNEIVQYIIHEYLDDEDEELAWDTPLISGGIVDSFSMISLKRFLENKYGIAIPDADASPEAFDTVDSIAALVERFRRN